LGRRCIHGRVVRCGLVVYGCVVSRLAVGDMRVVRCVLAVAGMRVLGVSLRVTMESCLEVLSIVASWRRLSRPWVASARHISAAWVVRLCPRICGSSLLDRVRVCVVGLHWRMRRTMIECRSWCSRSSRPSCQRGQNGRNIWCHLSQRCRCRGVSTRGARFGSPNRGTTVSCLWLRRLARIGSLQIAQRGQCLWCQIEVVRPTATRWWLILAGKIGVKAGQIKLCWLFVVKHGSAWIVFILP
jgi:hypothetical protein